MVGRPPLSLPSMVISTCQRTTAEIEALLGEVMTTCEKIRTVNEQGESWLQPEYRKPGPMMVR